MYYVTKEIKKNKKFKNILSKSINYPSQKKKRKKNWKYEVDYKLMGNAYEFLIQIMILKKENRKTDFHELKYSREKYKIFNNKKMIKIKYHEKKILNTFESKKIEFKSILYLTKISMKIKKIKISKKEIKCLKRMSRNFKIKYFLKEPSFNVIVRGGSLIGEIDILLKDTVIDIKTTRENNINKYMLNQVIIYSILIELETGRKIKKIGIYLEKSNNLKIYKLNKILKNKNKIIKFIKKRYLL